MIGPIASRTARRKALSHRLRPTASPSRHLHSAPSATVPGPRQRRKSSSKPSSPAGNGEQDPLAPTPEASSKDAATPTPRKKGTAKTSLARSKENPGKTAGAVAASTAFNLPSVPPTGHLSLPEVILASFFSIHRPIAVDGTPVPPPITPQLFAQIFTAEPPPSRARIDRTLGSLESFASQLGQAASPAAPAPLPQREQPAAAQSSRRGAKLKAAVEAALNRATTEGTAADSAVADGAAPGSGESEYIALDEFLKNYRPFAPPPVPEPIPDAPARTLRDGAVGSPLDLPAAEGEVGEVEAPSASPRQPFLERMRQRQDEWERGMLQRRSHMWRAISVRRQRKLKMKKHKYKKLMRRLRHEKRKQDRL